MWRYLPGLRSDQDLLFFQLDCLIEANLEPLRKILREVGWRDALDPRRMADVVRLESRLKGVRLRLQRMKAGRSTQPLASRAS